MPTGESGWTVEEVTVAEYWFNTQTKAVEEGHRSDWRNLMGPYATREQAERALQSAAENTERWDQQDRAWEDGED